MTARLAAVILVAAALALAALAIAPEPWPTGPGRLEVELAGSTVVDEPVTVGDDEPLLVETTAGMLTVTLDAPDGVPVDDTIRLTITVTDDRATLGDVAATVVLPDGSREAVPVLRQDGNRFAAERQPPVDVAIVLAMLAVAVVLWVSEAVPLFVTGLAVPVVLAVGDVAPARDVLAPFFDPIIVLFFAGFLLARAMQRVDLDRLAATSLVAWTGRSPVTLFASLIAVSAFLSMWMSNTAAVTVLLPVALAVTTPLQDLGYRKATVLGVAYAATIGGVGSAIGTPANPLAITFVNELTGRRISFVEWFAFGLPMVVLFLPLMGIYLWRTNKATVDRSRFAAARREARHQQAQVGRLTKDQIEVLVVFGAVFAGWLTQNWHDQSPGIVALAGAVVLFARGRTSADDLGQISWPTLLTFGGGLTLGVYMTATGAADWIVTRLGGLASWPTPVAIVLVAAVALGLTTVASNTAAAATLIPLAVPLAGLIGTDPVLLVAIVAVASSIDFALVIGTPPTMLAYSTDLFSAGEILRKGAPLDITGLLLLVAVVVPIWGLLGIV